MSFAQKSINPKLDAKIIEQDIESTKLSVLLFDINTMKASCSPGMRQLFALDDSEVEVEQLLKLVHEEDLPRVSENTLSMLETGYCKRQYRSYTLTGKLLWIHSENWVIYNEQNEPSHVVNHVFDISEIKHNEEALANSVSLHNLLMDKSVDAIWRVELTTPMCINLTIDEQVEHLLHNAVFAEHNPAYATSLGLPGADITGKSLLDISPNQEEARAHLRGFAEAQFAYSGGEFNREQWGEQKNTKHIRMWTTPVIEENKLLGFWGMLSDLTEEKQQEKIVVEILHGLSAKTGEAFFDELTKYIVQTFGASAAFLSQLDEERGTATVTHGYDQKGTRYKPFPADRKFSQLKYLSNEQHNDNIYISADHSSNQEDKKLLKHLRSDNYAFCLLKDNQGKNLGYLSLFFKNQIEDTKSLRNLLQIFTIRAAAELIRSENELALKNSQLDLEHLANHDSLTGLSNRHHFINRMEWLLAKPLQADKKVGLLLLDLDGFKEVNDTLGHQMGDALLITLSKRLANISCKHPWNIARLGGDEFAFAIECDSEAAIAEFATLIMQKVRETIELASIQLQINGSLGIAVYPDTATTSSKLMSCADVAMYHAKNNGQQIQFYQPSIDQYSRKRLALMSDLKTAVKNNEMALVYQPLIDVSSNQIQGFEALIRWYHPDYGLIMPMDFIPLAELGEAIHEITAWLVKAVAEQITQWQLEGHDYIVSLNLSAKNLMDTELINHVADIIQQSGIKPSSLELEITESSLMSDIDRATRFIGDFKNLGVNSVIDDYGTGYSSLAYLQRLPIEKIKIDRTFVTNMVTQPEDKIIVQSTIQLAHNLGKQVVAEGIEDSETLEVLKQLGCDIAQGYFFSKPMPAEHWAEYHQQRNVG